MGMLPGMGKMKKQIDAREPRRQDAQAPARHHLLDDAEGAAQPRRSSTASASGASPPAPAPSVEEINKLLKMHRQMADMMKTMGKGKGRLGKMFGMGGGGKMPEPTPEMALANAVLLLITSGAVMWGAIGRLVEPAAVSSVTVMMVAAIGIAVNGAAALLFMRGRESDLNIHGAFWHMAADAAVSLGVVLAVGVMPSHRVARLIPAVSLVIAAIIIWGTWGAFCGSWRGSPCKAVPVRVDPAPSARILSR